jgi:hypothetical protein
VSAYVASTDITRLRSLEVVAAAKKPAPAKAKPAKRVLTPRPAKAAPAPKDSDRTWGRLEADERFSLRDLGL